MNTDGFTIHRWGATQANIGIRMGLSNLSRAWVQKVLGAPLSNAWSYILGQLHCGEVVMWCTRDWEGWVEDSVNRRDQSFSRFLSWSEHLTVSEEDKILEVRFVLKVDSKRQHCLTSCNLPHHQQWQSRTHKNLGYWWSSLSWVKMPAWCTTHELWWKAIECQSNNVVGCGLGEM